MTSKKSEQKFYLFILRVFLRFMSHLLLKQCVKLITEIYKKKK